MTHNPKDTALKTLERLTAVGFDTAQVSFSVSEQEELNIILNEASLLRSTEVYGLSLTGIVDGRKADTCLTDIGEQAIEQAIAELFQRAKTAPRDEANALSSGETAHIKQGPQEGCLDLLAEKVEEILEFRASEAPKAKILEGAATYSIVRECMLTSKGSSLSSSTGTYSLLVAGSGVDGDKSSSLNCIRGSANDLTGSHASEYFGIGEMLKDMEKQIDTRTIDSNFVGEAIFSPSAALYLLDWLVNQLHDQALISGASIYKDSVGKVITSPLLNIRSRFDAPGYVAYTSDAFLTPAIDLVTKGRLNTLLPSFYGSRKTGLAHTPSGSGWIVDSGNVSKADLIGGVKKGALVNRLSMGRPGANGDFSAVIKNSFAIENGVMGSALSESMISGNIATMLKEISAVSKEYLDFGSEALPWIRIPNLNFS